jgi:4a-hydroxytetrahydrobiopterin dehydratase
MSTDLATKQCTPCEKKTEPLHGERLRELSKELGSEWRVANEHHLERDFKFKDFREALDFTDRVGELAEEQNHHPDIFLTWGRVGLKIWTHNIDGLSQNDFILAAKIGELQ